MMRPPSARQESGSCDAGKAFYRCAIGPFTGCCSTDPCDTGICGDESDSDFNPTIAKTSRDLSPTGGAVSTTSSASRSLSTTRSISSSTFTDSTRPSDFATPATAITQPATTSTAATELLSPKPQPNRITGSPVGAIVGGVIGGLALLALLVGVIWYCLRRKSRLRIKVRRGDKRADERREKEDFNLESTIPERQKFLDAALQRVAPKIETGDPSAEFGGYQSGINTICRAGGGDNHHPHGQPAFSSRSMASRKPRALPPIYTSPAPASAGPIVEDSGMGPGSISRNENTDIIPILDGTNLRPDQMPVDPDRSGSRTGGKSIHNCMVVSRPAFPADPPAAVERHLHDPATTSGSQSLNLSPTSSRPDSDANTLCPVRPSRPKGSVDQDNVVMRSNLNGSGNRRTGRRSTRKHVMSFMEYDTENESVCSSQQSSLEASP